MKRAAAALVDALAIAVAGVIVFVLLTGGGVYQLGGTRVSLRSVDNPIAILLLLVFVRFAVRDWGPFLLNPRWQLSEIATRSKAIVLLGFSALDRLGPRRALRMVLLLTASALAVRLALAWSAPGFYSGDDVEIHEMTLSALLGYDWPIWDLRSSFFPFVFILPVQWLALKLGFGGTHELVFAGRAAVAFFSLATIWLVWRIGLWLFQSPGLALAAAVLVAVNKLQMAFGSSELPRPLATVFVLAAFYCMGRSGLLAAAAAGALVGIAACFRFSEAVFLAPAIAQMFVDRNRLPILVLAGAFASTFLVVSGVSDLLYWGTPFHSLRAAVDYTLLRGESSRGFQGPFWYLAAVPQWTNIAVFGLAILGTRRERFRLALWAWLPLILLSLLPHKEPRYLIPVVPFVCLLCVSAIRDGVAYFSTRGTRQDWVFPGFMALMIAGALQDAGHWRLPRTNADVELAQNLATMSDMRRSVVEQAWRLGGHLYLPTTELFGMDPDSLSQEEFLWQSAPVDAWIVLDAVTVARVGYAPKLEARGYSEVRLETRSRYRVWKPGTRSGS